MNTRLVQTHKVRLAALAALAALILAASLLATPAGRAWAGSLLKFFTRTGETRLIPTQDAAALVEVPAQEPPSLSPVAPVAAPISPAAALTAAPLPAASPQPEALQPFHETCGSLPAPRCSLEQLASLAGFPVQGLARLPDGFTFQGATGGPDQSLLMYAGERGALYLAQTPAQQDDQRAWEIADGTQVEAVDVDGQPGEYIQGGWSGLGLPQAGEVPWENDPARQTLRWAQDGFHYTLWFYAYKTGPGPQLDKHGLVEIALSLGDQPSSQPPAGQAGILTLEQAAARAGFTPLEPGWLPPGYALAGASHDPQRNAICLHYRYRQEAFAPTLTLFQSYGWLPTLEDLKLQQTYNGQPLDIPISIASLPVVSAENGVATWAANGVTLSPLCGGTDLNTNKVLLWRADNRNFILGAVLDQFQGRGFLSNQEMQRLAESLSGAPAPTAPGLDPERLASPSALKALASFPVRLPSRMLADFHFDHAVQLPAGDQSNPFTGGGETERAILVYVGASSGAGDPPHLSIFQETGPGLPTLDELALAGGYEPATVNGQPGLYQLSCWDDPLAGVSVCMHILTWFEQGVWFEIEAQAGKAIPKEILVAIAGGLR